MRRFSWLMAAALLGACEDAQVPTAVPEQTPAAGPAQPAPAEGAIVSLNVNADQACSNAVRRGARVMAVSRHAVILVDTANPAGGFTAAEYRDIGSTFDQVTWEVNSRYFGEPHDLDANGRVLILFTRAVNELTPREAGHVVSGFFHSRDLFPRVGTPRLGACAASNEAEMFYMLAPDPEGTINGNRRTTEFVRSRTLGTLGHELEHLTNASRRLYVNNAQELEESWLDEGLAHVAEELNFYTASGLAARQNLDLERLRSSDAVRGAANSYQVSNLSRFSRYLESPEGNSVFAPNDSLATRGAAWAFLRYAADRRGVAETAFWRGLLNSTATGMDNLAAALGTDPLPWMRDWTVALYADDLVPGTAAALAQPSWNFRSVLPAINRSGYPLRTRALADRAPQSVEVRSGSSAYLRFSVAARSRAEIRTQWAGQSAAASCREGGPVRTLAVGEVLTAPVAEALSLCFDGGAAGAEFVYLPFHASTAAGASTTVTVEGVGVSAPSTAAAGRVASEMAPGALAAPAADDDGGWEQRLRARERRELEPRIRGGVGARRSVAAAEPGVTVTVLRVR